MGLVDIKSIVGDSETESLALRSNDIDGGGGESTSNSDELDLDRFNSVGDRDILFDRDLDSRLNCLTRMLSHIGEPFCG